MPTLSPRLLEELRAKARQQAIKKGIIRLPNRSEDNAIKPVGERPKVLMSDLKIKNKDKRIVTFEPNYVQQIYLDILLPNWRNGDVELRRVREIILKGRQFGFSTLILALFYLDTVNVPNTETVLIAHDAESTEKMFRMVHLFHERLPDNKRPATKAANRKEIVYPEINSTFRLMTAGTGTAGHSSTINNLHCSEVSRDVWNDPEIFTGLFQAVPAEGNIFQESTANGEGYVTFGSEGEEIITGSTFHVNFTKADSGDGEFNARFFAWWQHKEYRREPPEDFKRITVGADPALLAKFKDEEELARLYNLDNAQLYWRRCKIPEQGMGVKFDEQYPSNKIIAFRTGGQRFFDTWDDDLHTCDPFPIPAWWTGHTGLDWGHMSPYCALKIAIDPHMNIYVTHELYAAGKTNQVMAQEVKDLTISTGSFDDPVWADPSMWSGKSQADGTVVADVNAFLDVGLCMMPAIKNNQHSFNNVRGFLYNTVKTPVDTHDPDWWQKNPRKRSIMVFRPDGSGAGCPNLIRTMPLMKRDPMKPEKMLEIVNRRPVEDHPPATLGYSCSPFILPPDGEDENKPKTREQMLRDAGALQDRGSTGREMWG